MHNAYAFFVLYANIDNFDPKVHKLDEKSLNKMDKWLISKLNLTIKEVTEDLLNFKITESTQVIFKFVDQLSNWYIRRNRERFWASGMEQDKINAYATLYKVLVEFSKLIAPYVPFISDEIYLNLVLSVEKTENKSVHLCDYPIYDDKLIDTKLEEEMEMAITLVELGRAARNEAKIKNRQPLRKMLAKSPVLLDEYYIDIIASELNIKNVEFKEDLSEYTSYVFKPQLKTLGPKYGKLLNDIKNYLMSINGTNAYSNLKKDGNLTFDINGNQIVLTEDDLIIEASKKEGYITAIDGQATVVMDVSLDKELIEEGYIREIISKIQTMRKDNEFDVMDKINVYIYGNEKIEDIVLHYKALLLKDIMAKDVMISTCSNNALSKEWDINDEKVKIGIEK